MAGSVFTGGQRVEKAGALFAWETDFEIRGEAQRYVSRGGEKLEGALEDFHVDVDGLTALDAGASTGGFTDCLLKHGCNKVFSVDVGHGQLDWRLRNDPRVVVLERTNVRYISPDALGEQVDLAVIDVSFISLTKIIPPVISCVKPGGTFLALIKPQFEVGKGQVGKGGVVRDPQKHLEVIEKIRSFVASLGCEVKGVAQSRLLGPKGNKEFFILFVRKECGDNEDGR